MVRHSTPPQDAEQRLFNYLLTSEKLKIISQRN